MTQETRTAQQTNTASGENAPGTNRSVVSTESRQASPHNGAIHPALEIAKLRSVRCQDLTISPNISRELRIQLASHIPLLQRHSHLTEAAIKTIITSNPPCVYESPKDRLAYVFGNLRSWELSQWLPPKYRIPALVFHGLNRGDIETICIQVELLNYVTCGLEARSAPDVCESLRLTLKNRNPDLLGALSPMFVHKKLFLSALGMSRNSASKAEKL